MPTFNNSIPQPNDIISQSQDQLLQNFQQLYTAFGIDHKNYNDGDQGKHAKISFVPGVVPAFGVNEFGLYNNTATQTLYLYNQPGASTIPVCGAAASVQNTSGWTYLPSGVLMQWGQQSFNYGTFVPHTFIVTLTIPFPTSVFQIIPSLEAGSTSGTTPASMSINAPTTTQFQVTVWGAGQGKIHWMALGK